MPKDFSRMNYYEMLDIQPNATAVEIRSAYNAAVQMYQPDSLASYSLFSAEERKEILGLLDKAYTTLINEKQREIYNAELAPTGLLPVLQKSADTAKKEAVNIFHLEGQKEIAAVPKSSHLELKKKVAQSERIRQIAGRAEIKGTDLKEIREELGVSIERIHQETKIRLDYLHLIEEDSPDKLPAPVFLKGFIKAYLKSLCIEPADEISTRYMNTLSKKN